MKKAVKCNVFLGSNKKQIPQYGILGRTVERERVIGLDLNQTLTACLFGMQNSGKSYTLGNIIEMYSNKIPNINELPKAGCSVIFHYSQTTDYAPEWTSMVHPNSNEVEVNLLRENYPGVEPRAAEKLIVLCPPALLEDRRKEFPDIQVEPILFNPEEINVESWINLLGDSNVESDEMLTLFSIMEKHRKELSPEVLTTAIDQNELLENRIKKSLKLKIERAAKYINPDAQMAQWFKPGHTVVFDMRDEFLFKKTAFRVMLCALQVVQGIRDEEGNRFPKLVCFDECHEYVDDPFLVAELVRMVRLMRHKALTILFASQDPLSIDQILISLSSIIIMLGLETEKWVQHIAEAKSPVSRVVPDELFDLGSGECFIYARKSSDPIFSHTPQKVLLRARVTHHGGATKTAVTT